MNLKTRPKLTIPEGNRKHETSYKKYLKIIANRKQERFCIGMRRFIGNFNLRRKTN